MHDHNHGPHKCRQKNQDILDNSIFLKTFHFNPNEVNDIYTLIYLRGKLKILKGQNMKSFLFS